MKKIGQRKIGIIILLLIILISLILQLLFYKNKAGNICKISLNGNVISIMSLDSDDTKTIETENGYNIVQIKDGAVSVIEADCKNQICIMNGAISKDGQVISCLPHGLLISVESDQKEVDTVAY